MLHCWMSSPSSFDSGTLPVVSTDELALCDCETAEPGRVVDCGLAYAGADGQWGEYISSQARVRRCCRYCTGYKPSGRAVSTYLAEGEV
jgi:hypothetical protein